MVSIPAFQAGGAGSIPVCFSISTLRPRTDHPLAVLWGDGTTARRAKDILGVYLIGTVV